MVRLGSNNGGSEMSNSLSRMNTSLKMIFGKDVRISHCEDRHTVHFPSSFSKGERLRLGMYLEYEFGLYFPDLWPI